MTTLADRLRDHLRRRNAGDPPAAQPKVADAELVRRCERALADVVGCGPEGDLIEAEPDRAASDGCAASGSTVSSRGTSAARHPAAAHAALWLAEGNRPEAEAALARAGIAVPAASLDVVERAARELRLELALDLLAWFEPELENGAADASIREASA